jgi:hypothetical protein
MRVVSPPKAYIRLLNFFHLIARNLNPHVNGNEAPTPILPQSSFSYLNTSDQWSQVLLFPLVLLALWWIQLTYTTVLNGDGVAVATAPAAESIAEPTARVWHLP